MAKSARFIHRAFTLLCHASRFYSKVCSSSSLLLPHPRVVCSMSPVFSRLTLRPSAPVLCCLQDSVTRGRLAVRVLIIIYVLHVMACGHWFLTAVEKCLFMRHRSSEIVFDFSPSLFPGVCIVLDLLFCIHLGALKKRHVLLRQEAPLWITSRRTYLNTDSLCYVVECTYVFALKPIGLDQSSFSAAFVGESPMSSWVCHWKPFWILVGDSFKKKPCWKSGSSEVTSILNEQAPKDNSVLQSTHYSDCIPWTTKISKQCDHVPMSPRYLTTNLIFGNNWKYHRHHYGHSPNFLVPFPNAWNCHFQIMQSCEATRILSPSGSDHFTT